MMEAMNERERYIKNPNRLLRYAIEIGRMAARKVDDNLYEFDEHRPYTPENYPMNWTSEAPCENEEDLLDQQL